MDDDVDRPPAPSGIVLTPPPGWFHLSGDAGHELPSSTVSPFPLRGTDRHPAVILGQDSETGEPVHLGDSERRAGLYVLGRSGTGKSTLLLRLIDRDIQQGHGVFFLDPHGDAIDDLLMRGDFFKYGDRTSLLNSLHILDPEDKTHSFGINLLACKDITDLNKREDTYKRAYEVFHKLWENDWGLWLQSIIEHTLPVFIENPQYTLADIPRFLTDPLFRNHLVGRVTHFWEAALFWQREFAAKPERDQQEQIQPLLTRVRTLLGRRYVRDIISQQETTIDFAKIIDQRQIVLLKLSANLPADSKKFIGTILLSELLHAVRSREHIPPEQRHQFCIFVDEFQNFASFEDFAILFTQARKYGIAATVAHQERSGQFADNKAILGATDAAANKIFFQLAVRDAQEQAPEFAKPPPTETRLERQLVLSQEPIAGLLKGHANQEIREFVNRHLRPLYERIDDTKAEMERERLLRMGYLDAAGLFRIDEQMEAIKRRGSEYDVMYDALESAMHALLSAHAQTEKLKELQNRLTASHQTLRTLNAFFTGLMEGRVRPGQERFSEFLIQRALDAARLAEEQKTLLALYISLTYGDPNTARTIPFAFAQTHGLFAREVAQITSAAAEKTAHARQKRREEITARERQFPSRAFPTPACERLLRNPRGEVAPRNLKHRSIDSFRISRGLISGFTGGCSGPKDILALWFGKRALQRIYMDYVRLSAYPDLWNLVAPYRAAQFTSLWKPVVPDIASLIVSICTLLARGIQGEEIRHHEFVKARVVWDLNGFLTQHQEGGFVILALLAAAATYHGREDIGNALREVHRLPALWTQPTTTMIGIPGIAGADPLALLRLVKTLNDVLRAKQEDYTTLLPYFDLSVYKHRKCTTRQYVSRLEEEGGFSFDVQQFNLDFAESREILRFLTHALTDRWDWFSQHFPTAASRWLRLDDLTQKYLLSRACDIVFFGMVQGISIADVTFPEPAFPGAGELVAALVSLLQDTEAQLIKTIQREIAAAVEKQIAEKCAEELARISISPPATLPARVLRNDDRETVKAACLQELSRNGTTRVLLAVIDAFVRFCDLLSQPENHSKVPTEQYVEKQVNTRHVRDMADEMAQELISLPNHTAYAKVMQERSGKQLVLKRKIHTLSLPPVPHDTSQRTAFKAEVMQRTRTLSCKERRHIDEELRQRHESWRAAPSAKPERHAKQASSVPPQREPPSEETPHSYE